MSSWHFLESSSRKPLGEKQKDCVLTYSWPSLMIIWREVRRSKGSQSVSENRCRWKQHCIFTQLEKWAGCVATDSYSDRLSFYHSHRSLHGGNHRTRKTLRAPLSVSTSSQCLQSSKRCTACLPFLVTTLSFLPSSTIAIRFFVNANTHSSVTPVLISLSFCTLYFHSTNATFRSPDLLV